jgi:hypothetical protein
MRGVFIRYRDNCSEQSGGMRALLSIEHGHIVSQRIIEGGLYALPNMRGWSLEQLVRWTHEVERVGTQHGPHYTDSMPVLQVHELRVPPGEWKTCWTAEDLENGLSYDPAMCA